jgi:hypothetical protein
MTCILHLPRLVVKDFPGRREKLGDLGKCHYGRWRRDREGAVDAHAGVSFFCDRDAVIYGVRAEDGETGRHPMAWTVSDGIQLKGMDTTRRADNRQ